jgi:nucleoid-associated protein YgaU
MELAPGRELMGIFDNMFGSGAKVASGDANSQRRFGELKTKYQPVLRLIEQQGVQLRNLHVQDNKLFIKGVASNQDVKNRVWDQIKLVSPAQDDIIADIGIDASVAEKSYTVDNSGGGQQTYTVRSGDSLSRISKQFYGDADEYMRIFYANQDKLKDPDKIQVGQQLVIPPAA